MFGVLFRPVEISQGLSVVLSILTFWFLVFAALYFMWRAIFGTRSSDAKKPDEQLRELRHEWYENGVAIENWLKVHREELYVDLAATLSRSEFQELIWKDFEIYEQLTILDPKLKEDPIFNKGRQFYGSLIRTENKTPS
ncbi:MAG: hypothetical protein HYT64_01625 [Candidatus Yanofskybacteria bacterium]|nr:hypothetical protein [Candidatus Yanofskybacteria bacterium]